MSNARAQDTPETGHRAENHQEPEVLALVYETQQTLYETGNREEAEMTTEVKQPSFGDLFEKSYRKAGEPLFNIKREMELISDGFFMCYACTRVFKLDKRMTIRHREYCPDCYSIVKREPLTKREDE